MYAASVCMGPPKGLEGSIKRACAGLCAWARLCMALCSVQFFVSAHAREELAAVQRKCR